MPTIGELDRATPVYLARMRGLTVLQRRVMARARLAMLPVKRGSRSTR